MSSSKAVIIYLLAQCICIGRGVSVVGPTVHASEEVYRWSGETLLITGDENVLTTSRLVNTMFTTARTLPATA